MKTSLVTVGLLAIAGAGPMARAQIPPPDGLAIGLAPSVVLTEPGSTVGLALGYVRDLGDVWEFEAYILWERNSDERGFHSFEDNTMKLGVGLARDLGHGVSWGLGFEEQVAIREDDEDWESDSRTTLITGIHYDIKVGPHLTVTPELTGETDGRLQDLAGVLTVTLSWAL